MSHATGSRPRGGLRQTFAAFGYRNYRILWLSMAASFTAMQMQMVARGWLAHDISGTNAAVGLVMLSWGIPQLLFSLVGGAYADRLDKRRLLTVTQSLVGLTALVTAVLITIDVISIPWLFALGLFQGTVFAFNMPARQALLAELVPQSELANAIALNNMAMNATRIVGPAVAGVVIAVWDVGAAYLLQSLIYLAVLYFLYRLPPSTSHLRGAGSRGSVPQEIAVGLRYILGSPTLRLLMLLAFVPTMLGMPYMTLLPGFAVEELSRGPGSYGFMFTVTGIGAVVGSFIIAWMSAFPRKPLLQALTGVGWGAALLALGPGSLAFGYIGALVALALVGLFSTTFQTLNNTMLMAESRPEFYGRVMSVHMLTFSLFPFMSGPMGAVADQITAARTFTVLGASILVFILVASMLTPRYTLSAAEPADAGFPAERPRPTGAVP